MTQIPGLDGVLGVEHVEATADKVVVRFTIGEEHLQPFGIPHGGVYCAVHESTASSPASSGSATRASWSAPTTRPTSCARPSSATPSRRRPPRSTEAAASSCGTSTRSTRTASSSPRARYDWPTSTSRSRPRCWPGSPGRAAGVAVCAPRHPGLRHRDRRCDRDHARRRRPELDLLAVTAVWGNHAVEHTADNSRRTLDLIGRATYLCSPDARAGRTPPGALSGRRAVRSRTRCRSRRRRGARAGGRRRVARRDGQGSDRAVHPGAYRLDVQCRRRRRSRPGDRRGDRRDRRDGRRRRARRRAARRRDECRLRPRCRAAGAGRRVRTARAGAARRDIPRDRHGRAVCHVAADGSTAAVSPRSSSSSASTAIASCPRWAGALRHPCTMR